jgi:hypothetical protein
VHESSASAYIPILTSRCMHIMMSPPRNFLQELDMIVSAYNTWGLHDGTIDMVSDQMRNGVTA